MRLTRKELIFTIGHTTNWCIYAECCWYILMSASAMCKNVGMSACFARPFVHQSVASARLSVRLIFVSYIIVLVVLSFVRPFVWYSVRPSVCMSGCMYVHMYLCNDELTSVFTVDIENWIDLTDTLSGLSLYWTLILFVICWVFFRVAVQTTALPVCVPFYAKTVFKKSTHIFVSDKIVLFHKSFMTVTKGKS